MSNKRKAMYITAAIIVALACAWKPLVIYGWRIVNRSEVNAGNREIVAPFPWMLVRAAKPSKFETFSTLRPTFDVQYASAVIDSLPVEQRLQSEEQWLALREQTFSTAGLSGAKSRSFEGSVLCSQVRRGDTVLAYCKSAANVTLAYSGPEELLEHATRLIAPK